jgi:hypothetical protein
LGGSGRFTGRRGSCAHKEFDNGTAVYLIHVLRRATDSSEGVLGPVAWEASRDSREASRAVGAGKGWLG